jgi:exodeoxyribonuclease VII small subunit
MAAKKTKRDDTEKLSFEEAIKRLKDIVESIEQGEIPLEDSLEQYEQGMRLIKQCRGILEQAEERIEKISKAEQAESEPADEKAVGEPEDEALF